MAKVLKEKSTEESIEPIASDAPLTPHRCTNCERLLFKGNVGADGNVQVKCGRCGTLNIFKVREASDPMATVQDKVYRNRQRTSGK